MGDLGMSVVRRGQGVRTTVQPKTGTEPATWRTRTRPHQHPTFVGMLTPTEYEQHRDAAHSREPATHMRAAQKP